MKHSHSMPFGAKVRSDGSVRFRLWAPKARLVDLCLENGEQDRLPLADSGDGWFELITRHARAGSRYRFQIDGDAKVPDPASRFQPDDVHGASEVVDPRSFDWSDDAWRGRPWEEAVIYELHVGAFTPEGTFRGVEARLDYLHEFGVTAVELMPIADFPGRRNWGYDGVLPYAPDSSYGRPDDLKSLVQACHQEGLMIFLDVVYNHFGPEGNYLRAYAPQLFTNRHRTPWGEAINFDGPGSRTVRDFFIQNALYWLEEYHFDGLRLDAVHAIADESKPDVVTELAQIVRRESGKERSIHLILENVKNESHYLVRDQLRQNKGNRVQLCDAQWNDDIHHALHVMLTGESDGYYADFVERPVQKLCRCLAQGFAYQGEFSPYHNSRRGEPSSELPSTAFVSFLQNHDQVGNRAFGERIGQLVAPAPLKNAMEILLLAPAPPMLFMGEEFAATSPFLFFCDFKGELAAAVTAGRRAEVDQFTKFGSASVKDQIPDPNAEQSYLNSKLDWRDVTKQPRAGWLQFYRDLLSIRKREVVPHLRNTCKARADCSDNKRTLAVDWAFANGPVLELRANLSSESQAIAETPCGRLLYCSSAEATEVWKAGSLPPWSVVWSLRE